MKIERTKLKHDTERANFVWTSITERLDYLLSIQSAKSDLVDSTTI